jgi:hypothetical protein
LWRILGNPSRECQASLLTTHLLHS